MQATVEQGISFSGIGIHTGAHSKITIEPANPGEGIVLWNSGDKIPALIDFVCETRNGVCLRSKHREVRTVEHLLSAFYGVGITNAVVNIEGREIPALDGSSIEFAKLIKPKLQEKEEKIIEIKEPIFVGKGNSCIFVIPGDGFKISFLIDYAHPGISTQYASFTIESDVYLREIAPARTYSFKDWIDKLKADGLIQGGTLQNAIVIDDNGPLNSLRFPDEPVRHKILDLVGDLALLGAKIKGWVFGIKSGHTLNAKLVQGIQKHQSLGNWVIG